MRSLHQSWLLLALPLLLAGCANAIIQPKTVSKPVSSKAPPPLIVSKRAGTGSSSQAVKVASDAPIAGSGQLLEIGNPDAPALIVFSNESCQYCARFWSELIPLIRKDYVDTDKLRLRIAILQMQKHPASAEEAAALFCAQKQGKGLEMHDALFALDSHTSKTIAATAATLKLDTKAFSVCLPSEEATSAVAAQEKLAEHYAVTLAPTYVIGDGKYVGLPTYADLSAQLEKALR